GPRRGRRTAELRRRPRVPACPPPRDSGPQGTHAGAARRVRPRNDAAPRAARRPARRRRSQAPTDRRGRGGDPAAGAPRDGGQPARPSGSARSPGLRRVPIARDGLQHADAVAFGIRERHVSSHTRYLGGLAERLPTRGRHFPHPFSDVVHRDDDGRLLQRPIRLPREEAAVDRAGRSRTLLVGFRGRREHVISHVLAEHLRLPARIHSVSPVHRDDAGPSQPDVVLEPDPRPPDPPLVRLPGELPHELGALREPGRAERVTLREEAARRIHHPLPAVRDLVLVDQPTALPFLAEPERFVSDQLVRTEAVVELDHLDVLRTEPRLLVDRLGRPLRHADPDHAERPHREVLHLVRRHGLRDDLDRTREALLLRKFLRAEDRRAGAVGRGTTLEDRERVVDHARGEHLLERAGFLVLRARVVHRVAVVLDAHLGELLLRRAVLLHVLAAAVAEHDGRDGRLLVDVGRGADRLLQARELLLERALLHLLEAEGEHALVHARRDRLVPEVEGRRPGRAVVV